MIDISKLSSSRVKSLQKIFPVGKKKKIQNPSSGKSIQARSAAKQQKHVKPMAMSKFKFINYFLKNSSLKLLIKSEWEKLKIKGGKIEN